MRLKVRDLITLFFGKNLEQQVESFSLEKSVIYPVAFKVSHLYLKQGQVPKNLKVVLKKKDTILSEICRHQPKDRQLSV